LNQSGASAGSENEKSEVLIENLDANMLKSNMSGSIGSNRNP
jgi:hypothetical protein